MRTITAQDLAAVNPACACAPVGFDHENAMLRARILFNSIRESFPDALLDHNIQDATYHAGIGLGTAEIRLSNFGRFVAITSEETVTAETLSRLIRFIESAGYIYIPFEIFGKPFFIRERFNQDLFNQLFDYV